MRKVSWSNFLFSFPDLIDGKWKQRQAAYEESQKIQLNCFDAMDEFWNDLERAEDQNGDCQI